MADMLSQDEINALLGNNSNSESETILDSNGDLSEEQIRLLSEIGIETMNISADTLANNLRQIVTINDPVIEKIMLSAAKERFNEESLGVRIEYKVGVEGSNVLVLGYKEAKIIADLMQGGEGEIVDDNYELGMIDESALCEAMNQMVGSSSTILFKIIGEKVDINTPKLFNLNLDEEAFIKDFGFDSDRECIISSFTLKIGDLIDSEIVQIMPAGFANKLMACYNNSKVDTPNKLQKEIEKLADPIVNQASDENYADSVINNMQNQPMQRQAVYDESNMQPSNMNMGMQQQMYGDMMQPNIQMPVGGMPMQNEQGQNQQYAQNVNYNSMNAKPAQFQNFDINEVVQQKENINIIMDVPLEVTVEMGRTVKKIEEILEFSPGTIIELDKLAGDPIDILVNGKFVAKGEVVVIDENYGIRITDIINFKNRI